MSGNKRENKGAEQNERKRTKAREELKEKAENKRSFYLSITESFSFFVLVLEHI